MPSPLDKLAQTLGIAHKAQASAALDATAVNLLLGEDPVRREHLTALASSGLPANADQELLTRLQSQFGAVHALCLTRGSESSVELACNSASALVGRSEVAILDAVNERPESWQNYAAVIARAEWPVDELLDLRKTAHEQGALLILDATHSAWRAPHPLDPDFLCLGPSMAEGLDCGAVLSYGKAFSQTPEQPDQLAIASTLANLRALDGRSISAELDELGKTLRDSFERACEAHNIAGHLSGPLALQRLHFDGQEGAEASLFDQYFAIELAKFDIVLGPQLAVHLGLHLQAVDRGLEAAVARMRTPLIDFSSYPCGDIPFVFPGCEEALRERGLCLYRYPKMGAVDIDPIGDCMRIDFAPSDSLGEVTSSGFYVPTLITGDFDVTVDYSVTRWAPGPDSACLALFAQNEESTARYYAQRMSIGATPDDHEVLACLDTVLGARTSVEPRTGSFRLTRKGSALTAWHRLHEGEDWLALMTKDDATTDDVLFGVKIWSKEACGGLTAEISNLAIGGVMAPKLLDRLGHRDDPRKT